MNEHCFTPEAFLTGPGLRLGFSNLPPMVRLLLITDGTVTKILEAYFWETVQIAHVEQQVVPADQTVFESGHEILARKVHLMGAHTGRQYARAQSFIRLQALPSALAESLMGGQLGIGELVRLLALKSYRLLLDCGLEHNSLGVEVWRRYGIFFEAEPAIEITEWFPLNVYAAIGG